MSDERRRRASLDASFWVVYFAALAIAALFVYMPNQKTIAREEQKAKMLEETLQKNIVTLDQMKENERRLKRNDRYLWEQAAIDVLGWLRKGEFLFAPPAGTTERAKE